MANKYISTFIKNFLIGGIFVGVLAVIALHLFNGPKLSAFIIWGIPLTLWYMIYLLYPNRNNVTNHMFHAIISLGFTIVLFFISYMLLANNQSWATVITISVIYVIIITIIYLNYVIPINYK